MKRIAMYLLATLLLGPATLLMVGGARYAMSRWLNAPIESQDVGRWSFVLSIFVIGLHAVGTVMLSDWTAGRKAAKESPNE